MKIELETNTLAVLIAGLYCSNTGIDSMAIPHSIYLGIAEKLEYFLPEWDYSKISFEDWIKHCLLIYPKEMITEVELKGMQENSLYWEYPNGNVVLVISMDISVINNV